MMLPVVVLLVLLLNTVATRGCTSEPGYYAATAEDSLPGYAGISIGPNAGPQDCAIKCARVKGCVAWTFSLETNHERGNKCWLVKTAKTTGVNFDWVRGPPCNKDPWEIAPSTVDPSATLEPTTEDPIQEEETTIETRKESEEEEEPDTEKSKASLEPAVLALLGGLAIISLSCLTALFCWCGCCLQRSCSSKLGLDPSTAEERKWSVGQREERKWSIGQREVNPTETWSALEYKQSRRGEERLQREVTPTETWSPVEYKQSRREESDKSFGSTFYEDAEVYR